MQKLRLGEEFGFKQKLHVSSSKHPEKVTPAYGQALFAHMCPLSD